MLKFLEEPDIFKNAVLVVFLICLAYWGYLVFFSSMQISQDAIGYKNLGSLIYHEGWQEFYRTGPHYEPLYPFTISLSMGLADKLSVSYQLVQKLFQVGILFLTQFLILLVLNKLRIDNWIKLAALLYFGFSPAVVNVTFSLFTEIISYPFIVGALLCGLFSWRAIKLNFFGRSIILAVTTGLVFSFLIFGRALFEYVFYFFLLPYLFIAIASWRKKDRKILLNSFSFLIVAILTLNCLIVPYKLINKKLNGFFGMASEQYLYNLFGSVARRADELSPRSFLANLASIPGEGVCRRFFSEKECRACGYQRVDYHSRETLPKLLENTPSKEYKPKILSLIFEKAREKPLQQFMLMSFEVLKLPFWETTQLGFVTYPPWLQKLFDLHFLNNAIRFVVALLTYWAIIVSSLTVFKKRKLLLTRDLNRDENLVICLFLFLIIVSYAALHSIFLVITRYSLRIAPLYIICIAYLFNSKLVRPEKANP